MKYGGTPLHWAKSREIIEALVEHGCKVDAKNFTGKTALHVMVEYERLDCVVALIACGAADLNARTAEGDTALHLAVDVGCVAIVKALLVFEADFSLVNNAGLTAGALANTKIDESGMMDFKDREGVLYALFAVGAAGAPGTSPIDKKGQERDFSKCKKANSPQHRRLRCLFDEMLARKAKNAGQKGSKLKKGGRLLALDGGGIKGLVLARMLLSMEKILQTPIVHCFDWIAGTSTGGILALALAAGKSPLECMTLYIRLKDKVFVDSKPYNAKPLEELLQKEFGVETKLFDLRGPKYDHSLLNDTRMFTESFNAEYL